MNKERRKAIVDLVTRIRKFCDEIGPKLDLSTFIEDASDLENDEREYFDNMPESLQGGEKGQAAEQAADALSNAKDIIEDAQTTISEALDKLMDDAISALDEAANG